MDREYFLGAFVVAAIVGVIVARWFVARVGAWQVLREAEADRWSRVYVLGAVVVLLWVATSLVSQLVGGGSHAIGQVFLWNDGSVSQGRFYILSITSGTSSGMHFGIALGLVGYVLKVVREVGDGDSSEDREVDWARPSDGDGGTSEGGGAEWGRPAGE